jgi:hypothetical protein
MRPILLIEDDAHDAMLVRETLARTHIPQGEQAALMIEYRTH